jgi:hypothetical protein
MKILSNMIFFVFLRNLIVCIPIKHFFFVFYFLREFLEKFLEFFKISAKSKYFDIISIFYNINLKPQYEI